MDAYEREWDRKMDSHWRGKGRGGKKHHREAYNHEASSSQGRDGHEGGGQRHPPGLKGRDIGLWYARQNRGRGKKITSSRNEEIKNRTFITMDHGQERHLSDLLKNIQSTVAPQNQRSYDLPAAADDNDDDNGREDKDIRVLDEEIDQPVKTMKMDSFWIPTQTQQSSFTSINTASCCEDKTMASYQETRTNAFDMHRSKEMRADCFRDSATNLQTASDQWSNSACNNLDKDACSGKRPSRDNDRSDEEALDDSDDDLFIECDEENEDFDLSNAEGEYVESRNPEEDKEDETAPINLIRQEEEISDFMLEFYKDNKQSDLHFREDHPYHRLSRDVEKDRIILEEFRSKQSNEAYKNMLCWRRKLPSFAKRKEILDAIDKNQVIVISGETGCGKTTQVAQFILDSWIERGNGSLCHVVCTQPRRISAITIAERVADERAETLGKSVGYQIRLDQVVPRKEGSILYCTTGIMLKWLESDPWLATTSHIILDEVHERDILCDFLMIILRDLIRRRPDVKLILMSATLNAQLFSSYFGNCPMVNIPGHTFPVEEYFLEDIIEMIHYIPKKPQKCRNFWGKNKADERQKEDEYQGWISQLHTKYSRKTVDVLRTWTFDSNIIDYDLVTALIHFIVRSRPDGAILVFVPGWEQIRKVIDSLSAEPFFRSGNFRVIPLHSLMPTVNQKEVFEHPPPGKRKIIVATNIAETSITIDDVVYVIDCGTIKLKNFDPAKNLSTLQPEWISRANEKQRRGRAGRVRPGECFHLFTTFHESRLEDFQQPEMLRTRLEELCLQIKLLKLGKIQEFVSKAMQPPALNSLELAICMLKDLNALDSNEELTALGYHLARMPVDPQSGKMLLFAAFFSCLDPVLTVAASLSFKDAFYVPMGQERIADERKLKLANQSKSDHLVLANAYEGWEKAKRGGDAYGYCRYNYLSWNTLRMLNDMRKQFSKLLFDMGFTVNSDPKSSSSNRNSGNVNLIKAIVCAGLYPNVAKLRPMKNVHSKRPLLLDTKGDQKVYVHPKSVNYMEREFSSQWFVYHLKMQTKKIYLYDCTPVSPYPLLFFGGSITCRKDLGQNCVVVDDWITFGASRGVASLVQELRQEFDKLMMRKITHPCSTDWDRKSKEGALMHAIMDLLTTDEGPMPKYHNRRK